MLHITTHQRPVIYHAYADTRQTLLQVRVCDRPETGSVRFLTVGPRDRTRLVCHDGYSLWTGEGQWLEQLANGGGCENACRFEFRAWRASGKRYCAVKVFDILGHLVLIDRQALGASDELALY